MSTLNIAGEAPELRANSACILRRSRKMPSPGRIAAWASLPRVPDSGILDRVQTIKRSLT
jgi:hypothetical protein